MSTTEERRDGHRHTTTEERAGPVAGPLLAGSRGPAFGLLGLCIALYIATPYFLTWNNVLNILDQITVLGIMAVGMTFVILIGGIDLSVGSVLALSMMVMGWLANIARPAVSIADRAGAGVGPSAG